MFHYNHTKKKKRKEKMPCRARGPPKRGFPGVGTSPTLGKKKNGSDHRQTGGGQKTPVKRERGRKRR